MAGAVVHRRERSVEKRRGSQEAVFGTHGRRRQRGCSTPANVDYSGVTLNVARPDMNNYATLGVMLYKGIGGPKDFALWDLARRATLGFVLY